MPKFAVPMDGSRSPFCALLIFVRKNLTVQGGRATITGSIRNDILSRRVC
jgi:hypothetical protein